MTRDDRFYAFVVARTSRSRAHIRRISVHKRWIKAAALVAVVVATGLAYGFYGLTQQAQHLRIERENERLRAQNQKQQQQLQDAKFKIKKGMKIKLDCEFCKGPILANPHIFRFANYERFFCCTECRSAYKTKYAGRIEAIKRRFEGTE